MGFLSREELEAVLKREDGAPSGRSVMIGRRIISRVEDLPSQDDIDRIHAAKGEYVASLAEQANQPPDRVATASGPLYTANQPAPTAGTLREDAPPADDAPSGKGK